MTIETVAVGSSLTSLIRQFPADRFIDLLNQLGLVDQVRNFCHNDLLAVAPDLFNGS